MSEHRSSQRFAVALACEIADAAIAGAPGQHSRAQSRDLSRTGISLSCEQPLEVSSAVQLALSLVFPDDTHSEPLRVKAVVVWCTPLGGHYQVGAKFAPADPRTRQVLDVFLRYLDGSLDEEREPSGGRGARRAGKRR